MNRLNKIIELVIYADEYLPVTEALKVTSGSRNRFLCRKQARLPIRKVQYPLFSQVVLHAAVDIDRLRKDLLYLIPFGVSIMPYNKMILWKSILRVSFLDLFLKIGVILRHLLHAPL